MDSLRTASHASPSRASVKTLKQIYKTLFKKFGPQHWWPGETPFEVIVGAILTQNTNWGNVEKAIRNLKEADVLSPGALHKIPAARLAALIKPAGYFNVKARRLKNFMDFLFTGYQGDIKKMANERLSDLRVKLLSVNGVGPETADSILLYALNKPVFVVDAYTKRILYRHGLVEHDTDYHKLQAQFISHLKPDVRMFNEYHALIVHLGKHFCKPKPLCATCPLRGSCRKRL